MKRMIAFIFVAFLLVSLSMFAEQSQQTFTRAESILLVTSSPIENKEYFYSGSDFYTRYEGEEISEVLQNINRFENLKGLNLYFSNDVNLTYFKEKINYLGGKTMIENSEVYLGYYNRFNDFKWVNGKKVNVQLVKTKDGWVMGFPMILTGF